MDYFFNAVKGFYGGWITKAPNLLFKDLKKVHLTWLQQNLLERPPMTNEISKRKSWCAQFCDVLVVQFYKQMLFVK